MLGRSMAVYLALAIPAAAAGALPSPGSERLLVSGAGDQTEPKISGPYVVFTDESPGAGAWRIGIFSYGSGTTQFVKQVSGSRHQPAVAGQIVAFTEVTSGYGQVWIYDLIGGALKQVSATTTDQGHPAVGQDTVFWEDARAGKNDIWFLNLVTNDTGALPEQGVRPRASGKRVVYLHGASPEVKLCDTSVSPLSPILINGGPAESADIQGNNVAASVDVRSAPQKPQDYDIMVYTVSGQLVAHLAQPGDQIDPHISGHWVAFEDLSLSSGTVKSSRVVLWDYTSNPPVLIAPPAGKSFQTLSDIDYPRTVYADDRSGNLDVYGYDPTASTPPPDGGPPDGGPPDGGCPHECDDDGDCDDGHHGHDGDHDGHRDHDGDHDGHHDHDGDDDGHRDHDGGHHQRRGHHGECDDDGPDHRDGGSQDCETGEVLADLTVERTAGEPTAGDARFEAGVGERLGVCIDAERVSSAWVTVNDRVVATPNSFDQRVVRLFRRVTVSQAANQVGVTLAGKPGGTLRVRVLRPPAASGGADEWTGVVRREAPAGQGCGTGAGGGIALGALLAAVTWRRRRPK